MALSTALGQENKYSLNLQGAATILPGDRVLQPVAAFSNLASIGLAHS